MIPLRPSSTSFFARRRPRPAVVLPPPDIARFGAEQVTFSARAWTMRAEQEHRSAATFAALGRELIACGAPLDVTAAAFRVALDELGHTELCTEMALLFGAPTPSASTAASVAPPNTDGHLRLALRLWLVEGAIGETISSSLFARGRNFATEPCTRAALGRILRDEVGHARTSWEALRALLPDLGHEDRDFLQEQTRRAFGAIEEEQMVPVLKRLERGDPFDPAWAELGVLPPEARVEAFYAAVENRVRAELTKLGLDFQRAWDSRYRAHS